MPTGGTLTIRTYAVKAEADGPRVGQRTTDLFRPGDTIVMCDVTDTGTGIPREALVKVFDPFFTTRPTGQGTGLGLSVSRAIVEAHRGLLELESEVGRGTTARVTLQVASGGPNVQDPHSGH
jgi:signal transduction histidine kinase